MGEKKNKKPLSVQEQMGFTAPIITFHCLCWQSPGFIVLQKQPGAAGGWDLGREKQEGTTMWGQHPKVTPGAKSVKIPVLPSRDAAVRNLMLLTGGKISGKKLYFCPLRRTKVGTIFHGMAALEYGQDSKKHKGDMGKAAQSNRSSHNTKQTRFYGKKDQETPK